MHAIGAESPCRASAPSSIAPRTARQGNGCLPTPTSSTCGRLPIPPIVATACTCGSAFDPSPFRPPSFPLPLFSHSQAVANGNLRVPLLGFIDNEVLSKKSHALATNRRFAKITSLRRRFRSPLRYADLRNRRSQSRPCLTRFSVFRKTAIGRHLRTVFA